MRPALLRLLKRPSTLSVLDSLISTPSGIEHLDSRYRTECLRYQSQGAQPLEQPERPTQKNWRTRPTKRPLSFRVYEIEKESSVVNGRPNDLKPSRYRELQPEKLELESDIGHTRDLGSRMVDDPARRHDFALWEELLRYRQRHYGDRGTLDIWEGLMVRVDGVQLPVAGERADFFWRSFVEMGLKREPMLREVANYAIKMWKKTGQRWEPFYELVVGDLLERGMTQQAVEWHKKLRHSHLSCPEDILRVLNVAATHDGPLDRTLFRTKPRLSPGMLAFQKICDVTEGHQIYGQVIATLLRFGKFADLLPMHQFLVDRGDHPKAYEEIRPMLEYFKGHGSRRAFEKLEKYATERFQEEIDSVGKDMINPLSPEERAPVVSAVSEEKPMKDDFGARLFATKALSFDMILSALRMFGVSAIGAHSLREMAVRAHGSQDILGKLRRLEEAGISTGDSIYARLLRKLTTENREIVLSDLLHSDQHPDVFEDAHQQEAFLISYYITREWRLYYMTLAVLNEIYGAGPDLSNVHFRKHISAGEWSLASKVTDDMTLHGGILTDASVDWMIKHVITSRKPGVRPAQGPDMSPIEEVSFVLSILQRAAAMGTTVSTTLWVEMLKRLGMNNRWEKLQECCLWLARHYSCTPKWDMSSKVNNKELTIHGSSVLGSVFDRRMQSAIVAWGFRMRVSPNYKHKDDDNGGLIPWVRGLVLLRQLEQNGVQLEVGWIRRACRHRLAVLFGRPRHSSRNMNRMLRRENPYTLKQVVSDINQAWGEPALMRNEGPRELYELVNPPSSKLSQRRTRAVMRGRA